MTGKTAQSRALAAKVEVGRFMSPAPITCSKPQAPVLILIDLTNTDFGYSSHFGRMHALKGPRTLRLRLDESF